MSAAMTTILILGGTSGIGEAFARRFHAQGKRVIVVGRRQARLDALAAEMPGLAGYAMDVTDVAALPAHVARLWARWPAIDAVWVNAGVGGFDSFIDPSSATDDDAQVQAQIRTNVTAPTLLARHVIPRLVAACAQDGTTEATFLVTSGGAGFCPVGLMAVYSATKAYVHALCVGLRQQLAGTRVHVIEIVPPLVETGLGATPHNPGRARFASLPLQEYTDISFAALDHTPAAELREVSAGTGQERVDAWRAGMGPMLAKMGLGG